MHNENQMKLIDEEDPSYFNFEGGNAHFAEHILYSLSTWLTCFFFKVEDPVWKRVECTYLLSFLSCHPFLALCCSTCRVISALFKLDQYQTLVA